MDRYIVSLKNKIIGTADIHFSELCKRLKMPERKVAAYNKALRQAKANHVLIMSAEQVGLYNIMRWANGSPSKQGMTYLQGVWEYTPENIVRFEKNNGLAYFHDMCKEEEVSAYDSEQPSFVGYATLDTKANYSIPSCHNEYFEKVLVDKADLLSILDLNNKVRMYLVPKNRNVSAGNRVCLVLDGEETIKSVLSTKNITHFAPQRFKDNCLTYPWILSVERSSIAKEASAARDKFWKDWSKKNAEEVQLKKATDLLKKVDIRKLTQEDVKALVELLSVGGGDHE